MLFSILRPIISGHVGEGYTSSLLNSLPQDKYRVINNVLLETERGSTQIDHIVVSVIVFYIDVMLMVMLSDVLFILHNY